MRKHSVRKWLHAILDLLPIFLIPVFMIYSHRHTLTDVTTVDIQYKYQSNEVNDYDDLIVGNIYKLDTLELTSGDLDYHYFILAFSGYDFGDVDLWDSNLDDINITSYSNQDYNFFEIIFYSETNDTFMYFTNTNVYVALNYTDEHFIEFYDCVFYFEDTESIDYLRGQMLLPQYTDYNVIDSVQVDDITSSITDVFMDNFTHTVNTKFNFSSAFNFNELWRWMDTNLFGGQNSQVMYAIYNIIVYEFLMDVIFIIYCLFMFIIDFAESCLDRPFNVTKRGK